MNTNSNNYDVLIVGAGIAGMYMLFRTRELGLSVRVLERASDVGGTWYWNRYPGARCDTDTMEYSYSFCEELQQEWEWPERYPSQPEILAYLNHVADRFDLRRDIAFETSVESAHFDDTSQRWNVSTDSGDSYTAQFLVMGTGCLSTPNTPDIPGTETFEGELLHTGQWPHEGVDFANKRVGIIGTGSSAVQATPVIAEQAGDLYVFQRTPQYAVPARNRPLDPEDVARIKADYAGFRAANRLMPSGQSSAFPLSDVSALDLSQEERDRIYEERWQHGGFSLFGAFKDLILDQKANDTAAEFVRNKIRSVVEDPELAEQLSPDHTIACKRAILDSGYFETFNRPNVHLVNLKDAPIEAITPTGVKTTDATYDLDTLIFATGFDAMTGTLLRMDIRGRDGLRLGEKWHAGPRNYLGLSVHGFPNLFTITGPGSPSVLTNMVVSIEQHVEWIRDCLDYLRENGRATIEASQEAEDAWVDHVNAVANETLYPTCSSWYLGANIPGKPRVFMPLLGFPQYAEKCSQVAAKQYEGFDLA